MAKSGIIGHRGAAGLALENSSDSIRAALQYDIDAIEFDVRRTGDGKLIVSHDRHTGRIANKQVSIAETPLAELQRLVLHDGNHLLTPDQVFQLVDSKKPIVVDIKSKGSAPELIALMERYPNQPVSMTSRYHQELASLRELRPDVTICVLDPINNPFAILHTARKLQAEAVSFNRWTINPISYRLARRRGLEIRIYTVNAPWQYRLFRRLYPEAVIYSDHPERFVAYKTTAS